MKVLTKHGALENLKEYLDTLWEWSVRLYWTGCKYIGIALGKFKEKYELNKRFKGGIFSARVISSMKLDDLTMDKIIEELEYL